MGVWAEGLRCSAWAALGPRGAVLGRALRKPATKSHFVGVILKGARVLPAHAHGNVALVPGRGPVLMYQIGADEARMLIDVAEPLPPDIPVRCAFLGRSYR